MRVRGASGPSRVLPSLLAAAIVVIAGCASEPHLMPTPAVFKDERLDFAPALPAELRSTRLPVFYATTRAPVPAGEPGHYANSPGDGVTLGMADVRLGEPDWTWSDLAASDRTNTIEQERPCEVERIQEFGKENAEGPPGEADRRFIAAIDAQLAKA